MQVPCENQFQSLSQRVTKTSSVLQQLTGRPGPRIEDRSSFNWKANQVKGRTGQVQRSEAKKPCS